MMAELFARGAGICHGKGGSMHVADPAPRACSAPTRSSAPACRSRSAPGCRASCSSQGRVAVAFFGEGAVNQGAFHEAVNLAAIWNLPTLLVCENNVYAEFSDSRTHDPGAERRRARCAAYGIEAAVVDGNDVDAVYALTRATPPRAAATAAAPS